MSSAASWPSPWRTPCCAVRPIARPFCRRRIALPRSCTTRCCRCSSAWGCDSSGAWSSSPPAALTVVVQDNGVGIPAEALAGFRQAPDHFGLRTVAEQVESLGGELAVYNNDEQGAAMKAVLPLALPASELA